MASRKVCTCKYKHLHGSSRSLVRRIGSNLPISTGNRIYIRIPGIDSPRGHVDGEFRYEETGQRYVPNEEGLTLASSIQQQPEELLMKGMSMFQLDPVHEDWLEEEEDPLMDTEEGCVEAAREGSQQVSNGKQDAIEKISALESELSKLKAQIAIYALAEVGSEDQDYVPAPPPPPPPPLPMATPSLESLQESNVAPSTPSVSLRSSLQTPSHTNPRLAEVPASTPGQPDMSDMLQGIGSVKLRTVNTARSPGGTPLRPTNRMGSMADPNDPASIIALALRRKFSNRVFRDSPDKENLDSSDASISAFDSPTFKLLK